MSEEHGMDVQGAPGSPLVYYARTYRNVGEEAFMRKFESAELAFDRCVACFDGHVFAFTTVGCVCMHTAN